ncbi:hypothetical protein [Bacterioplanoides sp. SCSIO 12839]|uniref:hypothetical protein n=1 Tax=Bacterioplanoides sp. SCSIO 12839 TaxID=2829569 RepID=UPI002104020F|nr:hypothetical protein [Bacterioplanoides sp. SCSIO 12839]UTW47710.1 hypothetical protein KFF03_14225 [Bacterioplanoides sp. SCSIO 12839]
MKLFNVLPIMAAAALLAACGSSSGGSSSDSDNNTSGNTGTSGNINAVAANSTKTLSPILKQLNYSATALNKEKSFAVEIGENDVSMLLNLKASGDDGGILVKEIIDPAGVTIYRAELKGEDFNVTSDVIKSAIAGENTITAFLPSTPKMTLNKGTYRFVLQQVGDVNLSDAKVYVKSNPAGGDIDLTELAVDLNIFITDPNPIYRSAAFQNTLKNDYKANINTMLNPHRMTLDSVNVYVADAAQTNAFKVIDDEDGDSFNNACRALYNVSDNDMALNALFIEDFKGGNAGSSPFAGVILDADADETCFAVARKAYSVIDGRSSNASEELQQQAGNILHEAMHFMSLEHTTEMNGLTFDTIADTPECDAATYDGRDNPNPAFGDDGKGDKDGVVADHECGHAGGASNVLFWAGHPDFLPFSMTTDQAWVLKRHPLLRLAN